MNPNFPKISGAHNQKLKTRHPKRHVASVKLATDGQVTDFVEAVRLAKEQLCKQSDGFEDYQLRIGDKRCMPDDIERFEAIFRNPEGAVAKGCGFAGKRC